MEAVFVPPAVVASKWLFNKQFLIFVRPINNLNSPLNFLSIILGCINTSCMISVWRHFFQCFWLLSAVQPFLNNMLFLQCQRTNKSLRTLNNKIENFLSLLLSNAHSVESEKLLTFKKKCLVAVKWLH
jgi:hypothetical protein